MTYTLRPYQETAVSKMMWARGLAGNDLISVAQGGGKSLIIAEFANRLNEPVLILQPSKELLEQNLEKLSRFVNPDDIGVYSASMGSREIKKYTLATIQSCYKTPELFTKFKVAIIDEADLYPIKNLSSMYATFFKGAGIEKIYGTTGSPYRLDVSYERWGAQSWMLRAVTCIKMINRMKPFFWSRMLYVVNANELQEKGFLTTLEYKDVSVIKHEEIPTNKSKSEFDLERFDKLVCNLYTAIGKQIHELPHKKKLVFCSSVEQAEALQSLIPNAKVVTGKTPKKERKMIVDQFRGATEGVLCGVNIFTVGFDVPDLDCIVALRPTKSLRLWSQVIGRGSRIHDKKTGCTVYDFVSNVKNLGTLESIEIKKIEGKWNVCTSAFPEGMHYQALFSYQLKEKKFGNGFQTTF